MFAVIDIETTGGSAEREKITEIAIILHDGFREEGRFSTLINPERRIPGYITELTGISDEMVEGAPKFYEVAKEIVELTEGRVFVAHNVNFDYSFIREEFRRLGYDFKRTLLCTVRTSRMLIPGHSTYSLGRFCAALGIPLRDRHRALGDAEATALLLERLVHLQPTLATKKVPKDPFAHLPEALSRERLKQLPEDAGLFWMYDSQGKVIEAQTAVNIRTQFLKLFQKTKSSWSQVQDFEWEVAGNEWMAGLRMIAKEGQFPGKAKDAAKVDVVLYADQQDYLRVGIFPKGGHAGRVASFPSVEDAKAALAARVKRFELCPFLCGLESNKGGTCSEFPGGACRGACNGKEQADSYNLRLKNAMSGLGFPHGRFAIVDRGRNLEEFAVAMIDGGQCVQFGYLVATRDWSDWEEIQGALQPFPYPAQGGDWIRKKLDRLAPTSIKAF